MSEPGISDREAQPYMGIRTQVPMKDMSKGVIPQLLGEVSAWLEKQGVAPVGAPFVRFHVINMQEGMDIEMGWPVQSPLSGNNRISAGVLPAGRYASLVYTGPRNGIKGNKALLDWGAENGLAWDRWDEASGDAFGARFESYLTDPKSEPDQDKWEIEVAIRLANQ
jgi:effector-binding domain-containing protein